MAADNSDAAVEEATTNLLNILEGRPTTIDDVIAFLEGPAKEMMGEEAAAQGLAAQLARKEAGAKWCDCEACSAATEILAKLAHRRFAAKLAFGKNCSCRVDKSPIQSF
mgnify:CR=1 FL=1